jgi:hypothetical protein
LRREFEIEAELEGRGFSFVVTEPEFRSMRWTIEKVGPRAMVYPGQTQHARAAMQYFSRGFVQETVFSHLGWTRDKDRWIYLNAGGAIWGEVQQPAVRVRVPEPLEGFCLPDGPQHSAEECIKSSLAFLSVADDSITIPLLAAVYRAPFGRCLFSLFLSGKSGVFKSALAALCQQHYGAGLDSSHLPGNFASTGNALEDLAYHAKDSLLVIDDYAPTQDSGDRGLNALSERIFRAAGNGRGRSRLGSFRTVAPSRPVRGLIMATGERVPPGASIRARLVIVQVRAGDVNVQALTAHQLDAQNGNFAASMAAFVRWISRTYEERQRMLVSRTAEIRARRHCRDLHARLSFALAELQAGWEMFLEFALESSAIGPTEKEHLALRGEDAFSRLAVLQVPHHHEDDPARHFLTSLRAAILAGEAHVADRRGKCPESPAIWGWRNEHVVRPRGPRIGWLVGSDLYLDPCTSYEVVRIHGGPLSLGEHAMRHRLKSAGLLASVDAGRQMVQVRRRLEGLPRQVLHLKSTTLLNALAGEELSGLSG